MNSLTNLNKVFIPNTLDGINIISEEVQTNALLVDGTNKMLADLNMNTHTVKNLSNGLLSHEAVNLGQLYGISSAARIYSDSVSSASYIYSNYVSSSSKLYTDTVSNNVSSASYIYSNSVSSSSKLYADTVSNNVSSASYIFATTQSGLKIDKSGDTMTGILNMNDVCNSRNIVVKPKQETYSTGGGGSGTRYNYIRFNFDNANGGGSLGRQWCISPQQDDGTINTNDLILRCGSGGADATRIILGYNKNYFAQNVGIGTSAPTQLLDVNGASIFRGNLNMNTTNKIINVLDGTNNNDVVNLSQLNNVSSVSSLYTSSQSALKVDRAGDTMTGNLNMNSTNKVVNLANGTNPNDAINKSQLDAVVAAGDAGYVNIYTAQTVGGNKTFTGLTVLNRNASNSITQYSPVTSYYLTLGSVIYDYLYFSGTSATVFIPNTGGSDGSLVNKVINITFYNATSLYFKGPTTSDTIIVNGSSYGIYSISGTPKKVTLVGSSTIGTYTISIYDFPIVGSNSDQLTIKSNVGTDLTTEFTGIRFQNTTTDAGFLRVETDLTHTNSTMTIQILKDGSIINPLGVNNNIVANVPLLIYGGTSDYASGSVDVDNRTNTFLTFGPAGTNTDWAYLRQIGGNNDFHMSLDIHDDAYDGKVSFRNVQSTANPDTVRTFFKATATRGFYNPIGITIRPENTTAYELDDYPGITTVYAYGGQNGDVYLPNTREAGMKIEIINLTSQNLNVKCGVPGLLESKIKNGPSSTTNTTVMDNNRYGIFIWNGSLWVGYQLQSILTL